MHYFMGRGSFWCAMACGTFFIGTSILVATLALRPEEIRALRKNRISELGALAFLSLGFFIMINKEMVLGFSLVWFVGSISGGIAFLEVGWALRRLVHANQNI